MAMVLLFAAWVLPWWAAWWLTACCLRTGTRGVGRPGNAETVLCASLAIGIGLGASSCVYYLELRSLGVPGSFSQVAELAIWAAVACLLRRMHGCARDERCTLPDSPAPFLFARSNAALKWTFCLAVGLTALGTIAHVIDEPLGGWDAWAFWNQRARFLFRAGDGWRQAFTPAFSHVDYPLLIPVSIARCWNCLQADPGWVPAGIGIAFVFATLALLVSGVCCLRGQTQGWIAGLVLMGTVRFVRTGADQYADVPLAFFILATVLLLALHEAHPHRPRGMLYLAGVTAGLAAWTKNEGLLFVLVAGIAHCGVAAFQGRWKAGMIDLSQMSLGALPVLAVVLLFKGGLESQNDLLAGQGAGATLQRLTDPSRYLLIGQSFVSSLFTVAKPLAIVLPACAYLLGRARSLPHRATGLGRTVGVLALMLAGYCGTYVCTPHDLEWHLSTSFDRLILQIWPTGLLAYFLWVQTPDELLAAHESDRRTDLWSVPSPRKAA